ncbi:uncharacterized protein LOC120661873 isoform X1 [Panicum virgatum]|nr:uncharacterized protein LOC120661873 isoform X1 [Panicum virgatum]XP_039796795.1 uncharacterized protein LOC120661873 isoform X1 [Panicum virgatum]
MADGTDEPIAVEVPSFARATSIRLHVLNLHLTPPAQGGDFPVLEMLSIVASGFDIGPLISRCSCLRVLEVVAYDRVVHTITVHSVTIEELLVTGDGWLRGLDIVAPMLKKFTLRESVDKDFVMSLFAPKVENLSWSCSVCFYPETVVIDASGMWRLDILKLETQESGFVLSLHNSATHTRNLQEMFQLPNISVLELKVKTSNGVESTEDL